MMAVATKTKSETRAGEGLTVFVDPAAGYIYLKVVTNEADQLTLSVFDTQGKLVDELTIPSNQLTAVPLKGLVQGLYSVKVNTGSVEYNEKFIF
jgi:hypothetical protein